MTSLPILVFLGSITAMLVSVIQLFINSKRFKGTSGREDALTRLFKRIPLLTVVLILAGVFYLNFYYTTKLDKEEKEFKSLLAKSKTEASLNDYMLDNTEKSKVIDSLKNYTNKLTAIIASIKRQQYITGKNTVPVSAANVAIYNANQKIKNLERYNEIIDLKSILTNLKGYTTSGNTSNFMFSCPQDHFSEYVDLKLEFPDSSLIDKIACLYLTVYRDTVIKDQRTEWSLFEQAYKPKSGINLIKIRNYFRQPKVKLQIGYILKSESEKEYPKFEKVTCNSAIVANP